MSYAFASELSCVKSRSQVFIQSGRVSTFVRIQALTRNCTVHSIPLQTSFLVCLNFAFQMCMNIVLAQSLMGKSFAMQSASHSLDFHCALLSLTFYLDVFRKTKT